jgi:hypothetical protein
MRRSLFKNIHRTTDQDSLSSTFIEGNITKSDEISYALHIPEQSLSNVFLSKYGMKHFTSDKISVRVSSSFKVRE